MGSYKKKLFIVLLVILLIGFFVCGSVNATSVEVYNYSLDNGQVLKDTQEIMGAQFLKTLIANNNTTLIENFKSLAKSYCCYFTYTVDSNNKRYINCYIYPFYADLNSNEEVENVITLFTDDYLDVPVSGYNLDYNDFGWGNIPRFTVQMANYGAEKRNYTGSFFLPTLLFGYQNQMVHNYINGIEPNSSFFSMIISSINENTEQQEETTNEMKELNNFMKSEDVDQDAYNYPTTNPTQDPTTEGINNIFNKFYSRITNWDSSNINVYIPFAKKSFTIPANASEQLLNNFSNMGLGSTLKSLINAVWFYVLGRYIVKDVQKYVDGLKTGEILTKSDTNIKTEML